MSAERGEVVWVPSPDAARRTRMGAFAEWLAGTRGQRFDGYHDLWSWSVRDLEGFWEAVTEWTGVRWRVPPGRVLAGGDRSMPGTTWFPDGALNYAEHALRSAETDPDGVAVVARSQTRERRELSWSELWSQVARCRAGLQRLGVRRGDRVAAYAPNIPETVVAFLATASLGAIWSSCAPEFGTRAVIDRFGQIEPRVLLATDGYRYGDKEIERHDEVREAAAALPTLEHVVTIPYLREAGAEAGDGWRELLRDEPPLEFEAVPSDHPLYVLYSSGTTGLPKAIVHGHGGITAEHLKVMALHHDLGPGDRFSWFTTTGWMMWNYLVSGLLVGATIVLFDGDPGHPDLGTLWEMAAEERLSVFGASAPFLVGCRKSGLTPRSLGLGELRQVGSTGAPLPAAGFRWVRDHVGSHVQVNSVSGGTDVCTAFVGMAPLLPVRAGEISGPLLGCDVRAYGPDGRERAPGEQGELVLTAPMPSMPVGFWGDPDGRRMRSAYFDEFPGVWRHGDWITIFEDRSCVISGRSDATLNRGGVRIGTADLYSVVESLPEIDEALAVHLERGGEATGELVLFVVPASGTRLDAELRRRIAGALRSELSPRHVPDRIEDAPAVPRTLSGKKLEVPVKRILSGVPAEEAASRGSLANPDALDHFEALAPLDTGEER